MTFKEASYYREKFAKISLSGATIREKIFEECEFANSSFIDCKFEKTKFLNCKFVDCILSAVSPLNCRFYEVKFTQCKVLGIDWTKAAQVSDLEFQSCQINYSNFRMLKLPKIKIVSCEAKEVDFIETDLSNADLSHTDFERSQFFKTNLTHADFQGAKNYLIDVKNNTLKKARFSLPEALALLNSLDIIIE